MTAPKDNATDAAKREPVKVPGWLVVIGGVPLLAAMIIEFVSVIGRNLGMPILGTIELVQAAVLLSSTTAIVIATLSRSHAKVRLLLSRTRGRSNKVLKFFNAVGGTIFFLSLMIGSFWIMVDMWNAAERSELLGVPWVPLRCYATAGMLVTAFLYARRVAAGLRRR